VSSGPERSAPADRPAPSRAASLLAAALGGVLYFVGYVGYGQAYLTWICFVPGLWAIAGGSPRRALAVGTTLGAVMTLGGFPWIAGMLVEFAGAPFVVGLVGLLALALQQGLGLGLVFWMVRRLERDLGLAPVWSLPMALTAQELFWWQLFPFYIGASQYRFTAITQLADTFGIVGLATLIAFVNGGAWELVAARRAGRPIVRAHVVGPLAALALAGVYGLWRIAQVDAAVAAAPKLRVGLVQTNLGAAAKHLRAHEFTEKHRAMSAELVARDPSVALLVWPETAYNRWLPRDQTTLERGALAGIGRPIVLGLPTYAERPGGGHDAWNSVVLTSSTGHMSSRFDKIELVVFGETLPFADVVPAIKALAPGFNGFRRGETYAHLVLADGTRLLPMICYEDILPSFVRRMWDRAGPAELLVNVTNDSWYGNSDEPLEHLTLAIFRSIETRRALVRSTNTGISALVDPLGRITQRTGQWTEETLVGDVPVLRDRPSAPYQALGDAPLGALALAGVALVIVGARRRARQGQGAA
jgi:apolipoprotein N-acyltransferase